MQNERKKNPRLTSTLTQINSPNHINFGEIVIDFWICNKISVNSTNALLFGVGRVCLKHTKLIYLEVFV